MSEVNLRNRDTDNAGGAVIFLLLSASIMASSVAVYSSDSPERTRDRRTYETPPELIFNVPCTRNQVASTAEDSFRLLSDNGRFAYSDPKKVRYTASRVGARACEKAAETGASQVTMEFENIFSHGPRVIAYVIDEQGNADFCLRRPVEVPISVAPVAC